MFLRSVRLTHWACHDTIDLELGPGVNVVVGPNGAGKSTLCGAILTALTVKYSSKDRDLRDLEPWGTEGAGPSASLLLARPDGEWRLSKRYLHEPLALLERLEGTRFALRHKGKAADEQLARWLDADGAAGRLLLELWSPQADPTRLFEPSGRTGKLNPASLLAAGLADRLAAPEPDGPFALAKRSVAEQVARSFTPINRQVRVGSELHRAQAAFRDAEQRYSDLVARRDELARLVEEYRALEAAHRADCDARDRLDAQAERRARDRAEYLARLDALRAAEEHARLASEACARAERDHQRLVAATAELAEAEARLAALDADALRARDAAADAADRLRHAEQRRAEARPRLDRLAEWLDRLHRLDDATRALDDRRAEEHVLAEHLRRAEAARAEAEDRASAARDALDRAERDRDAAHRLALATAAHRAEARAADARRRLRTAERARLRSERSRLDQLLRRADALRVERAALDPSGDGGPVPTPDDLHALRSRSAQLDAQHAAIAADRLRLRFEAHRPLSTRVSSDLRDAPEARPLDAGEVLDADGLATILLEIEGVGRVEVARSSTDTERHRRQLEADRREFADRLASLGAATVADLERRRARADRRAALDAELAARLGGEPIEALRDRLDALDASLASFDDLPPDDRPDDDPRAVPIDALRAEADAADRDLAIARDRLDAAGGPPDPAIHLDPDEAASRRAVARSALDAAEASRSAATEAVQTLGTRLAGARARLADAERALADELGSEPDAGHTLPLKIAGLRQELVVFGADPPGDTGQAVRIVLKRLDDDLDAARRRRDAAAEALAAIERSVAAASSELAAARRRLDDLRAEADDDRPPEPRLLRLDRLRHERDRALAHVELLAERLGTDPEADDPEFEARRAEVAGRCRRAEQQLAVRLKELEMLGHEGLDTKIALADEHREDARRRLDALQRDARAWLLLDRVLAEVESDVSRNIARRLESLSNRWVARLTASRVRAVRLDPESLAPVSALPDAPQLDRALAHFSRGTREQVALACRLQLGALLAQEFRQMILLDDPLAHTDPDRHGEALDVFAEVGRSLQVLIFTCHPDRYARLWEHGHARRIPLGPDRNPDTKTQDLKFLIE